ncbi:Gfo/Idh/MocA family oxidoreductase [Nocardia sp. R6R-6]|uniref:Gfo/Idh/MocA family oxidoreductase n=1 Tax=Nocardia sp. R6R-6 TaxID=3459303 RepID=UPI00403DA980
MSRPIGIAVVGLGLAGGAMVPVIKAHPGFRLVAAVDPVAELRSSFETNEALPAVADIADLRKLSDVEAVYIASPHRFHRDQTVAAAATGRHVIVEKPMALTLADCDDMIRAATSAGVTLVVGHTHGFDPAISWIADAVRSRRYGALGMICCWTFTDFLYRPRLAAELDEQRGGGIWFNQVPHQVDCLRTIVDAPVRSVRAIASRLDPGRGAAGSCAALIEFDGGIAGSLVYSGYDHFDTDELYGWVGEGGSAKAASHGGARRRLAALSTAQEQSARRSQYAYGHRRVQQPARHPHFGELVVTCAEADLRPVSEGVAVYGADGAHLVRVPLGVWAGRGHVLDELFGAVRQGRWPIHDGAFAKETVRVSTALLRSAREGGEVTMDESESGRR